jgi:hypothetical protein
MTHDVFLVDPVNARVSQFSSSGAFIRSFGSGVADGSTAEAQVCSVSCFKGLTSGTGAIGTGARGIVVDPSTHIVYVVAAAARVAYFDGLTGAFLGSFTGAAASPPAPDAFSGSTGVALDTTGVQHYLYLATGSGTTSVIDKFTVPVGATPPGYVCQITGRSVASATECHGTASQDGSFDGIQLDGKGGNIAVDSVGNLFIAETAERNTVSKYASTGAFVSQFTVPGPVAVTIGTDGHVFASAGGDSLAGTGGTHILEYDPAAPGAPLSDIGTGTIGGSFGVAVDLGTGPSSGHVYVSDIVNGKVWNYAVFVPRALSVSKTGAGTGSVSSAPGGIDCGATCVADFGDGSAVVLTATPASDSVFTGWSGACTGTGTCNVTMDAAKAVTANFTPARTLTVAKAGSGVGSVSSAPAGINCGATCAAGFNDGTAVVLTAIPSAGSTFTGWSGACTGTGTCNLTMDANKTATANFVLTRNLTVTKTGSGSGSVSSAPAGINCGATCLATFDDGTAVVLTATAAANSTFTGWSGACTGAGTCNVTMDAAKTATANFAQNPPTVTTTAGATGIAQTAATVAGTVNPNGSAVNNCRIEYGTSVSYGAQVPCSPTHPGTGTSAVAVTAALSGLTANTTYHFRIVAVNVGGTTNGADNTFITSPMPPPTCETDASLCPKPPTPTCATDPSLCPKPAIGKLIAPSKATVANGKTKLKLTCTGAATATCKGKLALTAKVGKGNKAKTIKVGTVTVNLTGGKTKTLTLIVSKAARTQLKTHSLKTKATGAGLTKTITLKQTPTKKKS